MQIKTFDLTLLNGGNGFTIPGIVSSGQLGYSVAMAGDVNGDGISDLVLGASNVNSQLGASYVLFGTRSPFPTSFNLMNLNGSNGFTIPGIASSGQLGYSVSTAGDVNGDGLSDLVLGAPGANSAMGTSYVILGSRSGFPATFILGNLNGNNGFVIPGIVSLGQLGWSVGTAGDVNGDSIADLVLGAPGTNVNTGTSYVLFGTRSGFPASFNLASLNGNNGFSIPGINGQQLGYSVSTAGDVNGDGIADLLLGAAGASGGNGVSYVIFGSHNVFSATFNLASLNGNNGFSIPGIVTYAYFGTSVSTAGDINGDGISDLVLAAPYANSNNGTSYVIFGSHNPFPSSFNLANLNGNNGFIIPGITFGELGNSVATAGDLNADGIADLLLGAPYANSSNGTSYVIFGSRNPFPSSFNLAKFNGSNGFAIPGIVSSGRLGYSVATVGDVNGDGVSDFVLGAFWANSENGNCYVIFGGFASILFLKNTLTITEGQTILFSNANLNAIGIVPFDSLVFVVTGMQGGRFTLVSDPKTAIFNFTQSQINNAAIQFTSDRTNPVAYQVGVMNVTNNQIVFGPVPANVSFTNYPPVVMTPPSNQVLIYNRPFNFTFLANQTFNDADGDPLTYSATYQNGSPLPNWIQFTSQNNQLTFMGTPPPLTLGTTQLSLSATDPLNATTLTNFNITFVNYPPVVISSPMPNIQVEVIGEAFTFTFIANSIFNDPDGDPLNYTAQLSDGSALPSWLHFDSSQVNQLAFSGTVPDKENLAISLTAMDPLNASVSTGFGLVAVSGNITNIINGTNTNTAASPTQIVGGVVGGLVGLAALAGSIFGLWSYTTNKRSRSLEQFADLIRNSLNLKDVDNFHTEAGQRYVAVIHQLESALKEAGLDTQTMRALERQQLAQDVAEAVRNKISFAIDCLGRSVITVDDLNNSLQNIVIEVQLLRAGGGKQMIN